MNFIQTEPFQPLNCVSYVWYFAFKKTPVELEYAQKYAWLILLLFLKKASN